jgi:hypothetical protein
MTKEAKEHIEKNSLKKFTPEQREDLKKLAKLIEEELSVSEIRRARDNDCLKGTSFDPEGEVEK